MKVYIDGKVIGETVLVPVAGICPGRLEASRLLIFLKKKRRSVYNLPVPFQDYGSGHKQSP